MRSNSTEMGLGGGVGGVGVRVTVFELPGLHCRNFMRMHFKAKKTITISVKSFVAPGDGGGGGGNQAKRLLV